MALNEQQSEDIQNIQASEQQFDPQGPGDPPKKSPVTAKVVPIGTSSQGLAPDAIERLTKGITEGTSGIKQDVPHDLPFQPKAGQDNYLLRAQDQSFLAQLGKTAGNLIPNVAADIIDMAGQTANIPGTIMGSSDYDSGGMGKLATAIRDPFGEVYREHPDKVFDMGDSAWWLQNIAGFVEGAASFVLPGEGEAALFSKLGKLATEGLGAGKKFYNVTQALGHTISAFSMGYLMSAEAGKRVYDETYKTNYDRFIRQGYDPDYADTESKHMAADGAAKTVQIGTLLNGALNLTALAPLFKGTPQDAMQGFFKTGEGAIGAEESMAGWKSRLEALSPEEAAGAYRKGMTSHGFQAFQVGLQGLNTEYATKTGTERGTGQAARQLDVISDYFDKVTDQEGALNMLSGLLGGLTQNILMDRVPLHRIVRIDPATNKPIYKGDEANGKYATQLVSARTRDMMGNRQYFSSIRDAVVQDITRLQDLSDKYNAAGAKNDRAAMDKYRTELMSVGDLNAVTMGMTDSWKEVYKKMGEKNPQLKQEVNEAIEQLTGLQKIYDKVNDRMAIHQGVPDVDKLQDHMFHQEANHYLMGRLLDRAERQVDGADTNTGDARYEDVLESHVNAGLTNALRTDATQLEKAIEKDDHVQMAEIAKRYGVNAYDKRGLKEQAKDLARRLRAREDAVQQIAEDARSLVAAYDQEGIPTPDPDLMAQRIAIAKAREEHTEQKRGLAELRSSEGRKAFLEALRKNNDKWKEALDDKAARDTENLFRKQQDKEAAAKLDKEQLAKQHNDVVEQQRGNVDKFGVLAARLTENREKLKKMEEKKGFFRNAADLPAKYKLRSQIARDQAEMAKLEAANKAHDATLQNLGDGIQQAAVKEDTVRNAHREDVENDLHSQQNISEPTKTEPTPDEGVAGEENPIPKSVGLPSEEDYAALRESLPADILNALDNLELVMPQQFSWDLAMKSLHPFVEDQRISQATVDKAVATFKDWWENRSQDDQDAVPVPSTSPVPGDPIDVQSGLVSDIPQPDSPIISFNAALNIDNMVSSPVFQEVGAKALTSTKVNSRSIQYMRVEKGNKILFLPMYDKLDPSFNKNILKPGFVSDGDALRFEVDTDWNGQVILDRADAPDEYGMPTTRGDSFADYSTPEGKIIMTRQAEDLEPAYGNVPIRIVHEKSGETIGYLPRVDWVTAKRPDSVNYRNIEDNIVDEHGEVHTGNVEAQKEKIMAVRAAVAQAHNRGEEAVRTSVSGTGPGHLFLSTDVNVNTERSKLAPKLAKNLLPDRKLKLAILDKGTMMIGHGTPHVGPANFDAKTLTSKYQTAGEQWRNTPMVLLPMPNGKVTESPLFTRKLADRPADIHTIAKAVESYLVQGTAAETAEHTNIINKLQQHTGYDISTTAGLRSFINQYYTYTQKFNEVHTRSNAETSGAKVPRFMLDIPEIQPGEAKAAIKVGTSFSGTQPVYALTRDGKINPEFDQILRDGLQTHYKNIVYTSQDIKGINDRRPVTAVTIQRDGKIRTDKFDSYNEYAKSFTTTVAYGLHQANDGTYLYGANPVTEFDFRGAVVPRSLETKEAAEENFDTDEFIRAMMNSAVAPDNTAVDYRLKVVEGLSRIPERMFTDFFQKGNKEKFYSELQEKHGVPKQQVEMLKAYNEKNKPASLGEMMAGIAADMSYTVEVKTAVARDVTSKNNPDLEGYTEGLQQGEPTNVYAGMTVPGGTNYRENEIRTPDITPSIKGHAAFSSEHGIGWFRSDDKRIDDNTGKMVSDGAGGLVQEGQVTDKKTRRILEVQSDLFQQGRDKSNLVDAPAVYSAFGNEVFKNDGTTKEVISTHKSARDAHDEAGRLNDVTNKAVASSSQNQFLQLLSKGNNWATFFVKSIIQDSVRKGYEDVLFPVGNTAAKVEGHENIQDFIARKQGMVESIKLSMQETESFWDEDTGKDFFERDGKYYMGTPFEGGVEATKEQYEKARKDTLASLQYEMDQHQKEIDEARAGTLKISSVADFYENTIHNILKKQQFAPERIKDEHGNEWYKVDVGEIRRELAKGLINLAVAGNSPAEEKVYTREQLVATAKGAPLSEEAIQANINKLYDEAAANPEQGYSLDIKGAGKTRIRLADGSFMNHFKLAQMLNSREIPYNVKLSDDIRSALENTPRRFLNSMMFQDDSVYAPLRIDDKVLGQQLDNTFVPVRDETGSHTGGYFSPERQTAVVDSVVKAISLQLDRNPRASVGEMMGRVKDNVFGNLRKIYERLAAGETVKGFDVPADQARQMAVEYGMVLNSFEPKTDALSFWGEAMKKMDQLGIRVRESTRPERDDEVPAITNGNEEIMEGSDGKGREWFDDHFEQNPMDSASSRVKMFVATTTDSTLGTEPTPPRVKLAIDNEGVRQRIAQGKVLFTSITVEEAKRLGLNGVGTEGFNTIDGKPFRITNVGVIQEGDVHAPKISYEENKEVNKGDIKLQFTPWKPKPEQLIPNRNYLGLPKLADYEKLYEDAMAALGDTPRGLDSYIARLKEDGRNGKPNLFALAVNLEKASPQIQDEFISVMTLHYQPQTMMLADPKVDALGKPYYALRVINANRASQLNMIVDHWQQSQKTAPILEKTAAGTTVVASKLAQQLKTELHAVNQLFEKGDGTAPTKAADLLKRTLESNGIVLPEKGLESLIANTKRWTQKTSLAGDFRKQFAVTGDGKAQGLVSAFILRLAGEGGQEEMLDSVEDKSYQLNNPLYMEGTALKVLSRVAAAYAPRSLYSNTHRNSEGKSIYDWGLPHKLSNDFNKLKSNEQWRQQFQASDFAKRSWLLEHISNNPELRDRAGLSYLDGIRAARGKSDSGTTRPAMSDREQLFTAVGLFQNGSDSRYAHYLSLTHSDRSTTPVYLNMPRIPIVTTMRMEYDKINDMQRPKFGIHDEVVKRMYDVFLSEYDRINKAAQIIEREGGYNDARYEKGSQHFYGLPQFNYDRMKEMVKDGKLDETDFNSIWMMGERKLNVLEGRGFKEAVDRVLRQHVEELMTNTVREWKEKGLVSEENVTFDRKYINKLLSHVGIYGNKDGTYRTRDNQEVPQSYINRLSAQLAARDFAVNSFLFNTSLSQVFFGDPAQNWKGSVEKTMVEYGKRLTQFISPRKEGNWRVPEYTAVTVKDFITKADYLGELSKAYRDINATDAQEVTTVLEKLNVARAYGRISEQQYNEMAGIVKAAKGGYYEFTKPEHLAFIMQPEKPLYSGARAPFQGAILNDYVKSSAYPLYPPLTAGKELDKLRVAMEKSGVDRVNFESAKKVGIPAAGLQLFDSQGRINQEVFDSGAWTGTEKGLPVPSARQTLSRDNFGLSQEVPYDETKEAIRTVSQMNKLIVESIPTITTPFEYKGEKLSGTELSHRKEEIRKELIRMNRDKLLDEAGAALDENGDVVIKDRQKVYDALLKHAEEQGGYSPNDLAILQHTLPNTDELIIPLMYSPSAAKFESLVMSMVNGITDIYMPGKSYVQASSAGHRQVKSLGEMSPAERKAIVRIGDWDGGELKMLRPGENGESLPAQIILPFNFMVNGKPVSVEKYVITDDQGNKSLDLNRVPKELLQLVGARIPNSGHNLMLPTEIVGFVPGEMGDLAIVPDAITRQMGSDFDVDKLYTYRRGYIHDKATDSFKMIPEESDNTEGKLKNDYFETHWSVLMNPEMRDKVLAPLDKEDLKDEAAQIEQWESKGKRQMSFFDPVYQLQDYQSQKDAKQLVGRSSLSVTFNSVIQDKGLTIGFIGLDEAGNMFLNTEPIILIDEDGKKRELSHLSGYGRSEYRKDGEKTGQVRTKNDNHVMQQAEFLDYSKNRISDKVHLTVHTYPASAALTQLQEPDSEVPGWTPGIKYNTRLLSQPIIQEYSKLMAQSQDTFSESFDPDRKNSIIAELSQQYIERGKIDPAKLKGLTEPVTFLDLTDALKKGDAQADYHLKQLKALQLFKQLDQVGTQMATAQSTINQDVNGAGPNLLTTMGKDTTRARIETPIGSAPDKLAILQGINLYTRKGGQPTEQGALYDTMHKAAYGIAGDFFPYKDMKPMFDFVMEHTNREDLSVDMQRNIFNAMKSYLFSHPKLGLWEDPIGTRAKLLYGDSLAKRVLDAKNTWAKDDLFIQRLQPDIDPDGLRPDYVKYQGAKISKMDQDENTRHWVDLLTSSDPVKQQLGHDLVQYAYLTGGIQDSTSFIKFLPYSYLIGTDFGHKLRELTGNIEKLVATDTFKTQVFQHNPQIAKNVSADFRETGGTYEKYPERFTLPAIDAESGGRVGPAKDLVIRATDTDGKRRPMYPEFLSHYSKDEGQWILYKKSSLFNGSELGCNYIRIDTLGDSSMDEYSFTENVAQRSLIPTNRSFAYSNIEPAFRMLNSAVTHEHGREVLKDLDLPDKGGHKEMSEALARLAIDKSVPEHSRILSSWLATLADQGKSAAEALSELSAEDTRPFSFHIIKTPEEMAMLTGVGYAAASMNSIHNRLYMGEFAVNNKTELAMYLNHELLHYHTATVLHMAEDNEYLLAKHDNSLDILRFLKTGYSNVLDKHPEVGAIIEDLHKVRRQAMDAIKQDILKRGLSFEQEYNKVFKENRIENDWHRRLYATASNQEFVSHVLTDTEFMKYLNGKDDKTKGILNRVVDIVKRIMSAVAHALGTDVRKGSLLESAIDKSMALMLHGRAEAVPTREEMATPNNMESRINLMPNAIVNPTLTSMDRLAGKLQEQHDELVNSLTGRLTKKEYSEKRTQLDQIEQDIEALRKHQSFQIAAEIGNRHLDWVAEILKQDEPTPSQVMTANRVLEVWGNLIPLVYGEGEGVETPDPAFAQLAAKAQDMDFKMLRKAEKALVKLSDGTITMRDYSPTQLKDISKDQSLLRDVVSAASAKVTQYIGTHMQVTARHAFDDITRLVKETRAVEDGLKETVGDLPTFYEKFFQKNKAGDAWGLVQRFSQNWYDFRRSERAKRQSALKRIDEGAGDPAQKAQMKAQAWDHYWKTIDKHAIFADTRKLFDKDSGDLKDDDIAKAHIAELEKHTDKETAQELVREAKERYRQYLDHKEPYFDQLDGDTTKTPEEVKKLKDDFVNKWSPNTFFANRSGKFGTYGGSDYYAKMAPRSHVKEFYDDKFQAVHTDPVAKKFYTWLTGKMEELKSALPVKVSDEYLGANFFPVVKKSLVTDMLDIPEYIRTMGERTMRDLGATPWEEAMNASTFRQIPIDYIDRDMEKTPLETRSKDIPRVLEVFGMMALHYKHFSDARDSIDMGEAILQKLDQARAAGTTQMEVNGKIVSVNDGLKNTLEAVRYMKDYLVYRKARQLEGRSDMKLYSLNPVKQIKSSNRVKELLAEREKIYDQIMNGEIDPEEGVKLLAPIDAELKTFDGLRIYGSKLGDKLITINQLKTLSYNPFSGLANMTFGVVSAAIHANGGRDYSWKDLGAALRMMMHSTAKWVTFGSKESLMAEKILAIMDRTGVVGDVVDSRYGKIDIRDRKAAWRHAVNPYNWMRSGDYFMKGLTTMAMLLHDKVKVTEGGVEKEVSLWEALDQDGKWDSKRFGERKDWYSEDVKEQKSWDQFRNKAVRVNMIIHGNQDKTSPKLANKFILGRLLGQFRMSWLPEGWYSRFQKEHFDIQLDREVKGRYRTISQLGFGGYIMTTLKQLYSVIGKIDPYTGQTRLDGKALTETDRENMRRNFAELAFVTGILGMVVMTRAAASDTDDEKTAARYRLLMNMLIRNKQDLEFYASPQVFSTVTRDVIPAANVLKDFGKFLTATGKILFNDDYEFQQWLLAMTHAGIPIPQATLINKVKYMTSRDLDDSPY